MDQPREAGATARHRAAAEGPGPAGPPRCTHINPRNPREIPYSSCRRAGIPPAWSGQLRPLIGALLLALVLTVPLGAAPAWAADLQVSQVRLEPCPAADAGSQPELVRPSGASCYALRGRVTNPGRQPVVDTDVFALILDSSGEPVLPNRSRVGSIGDVPPGESEFALRLAVPAGTPGPFVVRNARARGFKAPVRSRAAEGDELLPLEEAVAPG